MLHYVVTKRAPIPGNLILCCMRGDLNQKENLETLESSVTSSAKNAA